MRWRLGILVALGLLLATVLVVNSLNNRRQLLREELYLKTNKLYKYRAILKNRDEVKRKLEITEEKLSDLEKGLLKTDNPSVAMVNMQEIVREYIDKASLKLLSMRPLTPVKLGELTGYPVQVTATGTIKEIVEFLKQIHQGRYLMDISFMSMRQKNIREPGVLRLKIEIRGFSETLTTSSGGKRL
jgi:Tfp pilus assembly protein PilO